jgi:MFS transporter, DHA2 family, multidrug resistance protein
MLGAARLLGQTIGAALLLARNPVNGTKVALLVGVGFAMFGAALSTLRLSPAGAHGAEEVRVKEGQRATGE